MMRRRTFLVATAATALVAGQGVALGQDAAKLPRVALFDRGHPISDMTETGHPWWRALLGEMRKLGYVEGQTVTIDRWSGLGLAQQQLPELGGKLFASRPDVVVVRGGSQRWVLDPPSLPVPVVQIGTFPARFNRARPGGDITGFDFGAKRAFLAKQVQYLQDVVPSAVRIAVLATPRYWNEDSSTIRAAAEQLGLTLVHIPAHPIDQIMTEQTVRSALSTLAEQDVDALFVTADGQLSVHYEIIAEAALAERLPAIASHREFVDSGLLMLYESDILAIYRSAAGYAVRILEGADPGELPIQENEKFNFVVNLKTARALGITLPPKILFAATEVIE